MTERKDLAEWVRRLADDERARMQGHLERQRRARAAVKPHAEYREAERLLRAEAKATSDPDRRRGLLRQADHHAGKATELVRMVERLANGGD